MSQDNNKSSDSAHEQSVKYVPPKVWVQDKDNGGKFASINRPTAGARHQKALSTMRIKSTSLRVTSLALAL